jgi:hypothetical protein
MMSKWDPPAKKRIVRKKQSSGKIAQPLSTILSELGAFNFLKKINHTTIFGSEFIPY